VSSYGKQGAVKEIFSHSGDTNRGFQGIRFVRGTGRYYLRNAADSSLRRYAKPFRSTTNFHFLLVTSKTVNDQGLTISIQLR
jgi:hypothetical protein